MKSKVLRKNKQSLNSENKLQKTTFSTPGCKISDIIENEFWYIRLGDVFKIYYKIMVGTTGDLIYLRVFIFSNDFSSSGIYNLHGTRQDQRSKRNTCKALYFKLLCSLVFSCVFFTLCSLVFLCIFFLCQPFPPRHMHIVRVDTPKFSLQFSKTKLVLFESPYLCEKNEGSFIKIGKVLPKLFHFSSNGYKMQNAESRMQNAESRITGVGGGNASKRCFNFSNYL